VFILTEKTPNPDALKLKPDRSLTAGETWATDRRHHVSGHSPLADRFLALAWIDKVFIAPDFVTVTRVRPAADWSVLRAEAIMVLADFLASGLSAVLDAAPRQAGSSRGEIEDEIQTVIARYLQPGVARDGGEIRFVRFEAETGVLWIEMRGACGGCPSSRLTLKGAVEATVWRYVPEVTRVEEIQPAFQTDKPASRWRDLIGGRRSAPASRTRFLHNGRDTAGHVDSADDA
jgi:NFU1 iron-sulfur cluster scaffold homolog, mitochondrial